MRRKPRLHQIKAHPQLPIEQTDDFVQLTTRFFGSFSYTMSPRDAAVALPARL